MDVNYYWMHTLKHSSFVNDQGISIIKANTAWYSECAFVSLCNIKVNEEITSNYKDKIVIKRGDCGKANVTNM